MGLRAVNNHGGALYHYYFHVFVLLASLFLLSLYLLTAVSIRLMNQEFLSKNIYALTRWCGKGEVKFWTSFG